MPRSGLRMAASGSPSQSSSWSKSAKVQLGRLLLFRRFVQVRVYEQALLDAGAND